MIRTSFTVSYRRNRVRTTVLGVTHIVPNLNGFLFFTEDGENHFIESCELTDGNSLNGVYFEYSTQEDLAIEFEMAREDPENSKVIDHRRHWQDPV